MASLGALPPAELENRDWSPAERANVAVVLDAYRVLTDGANDSELLESHCEDYQDHAATVPGGDLSALRDLVQSSAPATEIQLLKVSADADRVWIFSRGRRSPDDGWDLIMEIFRVRDGRVAEHWEAIEPAGHFATLVGRGDA